MGGLSAQKIDDLRQPIRRFGFGLGWRTIPNMVESDAPRIFDERLGYLRNRKYEVDRACGDRVSRHSVIASLVGILRHDKSALVLDGFQPKAAVGPRAREDDANRAGAAGLSERMKQKIERHARAMTRPRSREAQDAGVDGE